MYHKHCTYSTCGIHSYFCHDVSWHFTEHRLLHSCTVWICPPYTLLFCQVRLNPAESSDVLKRWAEHLCSPQVNQKSKAILVLLSLGCFYKVGEMLHRYDILALSWAYYDVTIRLKFWHNMHNSHFSLVIFPDFIIHWSHFMLVAYLIVCHGLLSLASTLICFLHSVPFNCALHFERHSGDMYLVYAAGSLTSNQVSSFFWQLHVCLLLPPLCCQYKALWQCRSLYRSLPEIRGHGGQRLI